MMLEKPQPPSPLPRWLMLPLGLGLLLTTLGFAMPWLYPQRSLWTEEDAKQHSELARQAHAAHHRAANAQTKKLPTVKEDAAKASWYLEQYHRSEERLRSVQTGGSFYGKWFLVAGITLTAIGIIAAWMIRRE